MIYGARMGSRAFRGELRWCTEWGWCDQASMRRFLGRNEPGERTGCCGSDHACRSWRSYRAGRDFGPRPPLNSLPTECFCFGAPRNVLVSHRCFALGNVPPGNRQRTPPSDRCGLAYLRRPWTL